MAQIRKFQPGGKLVIGNKEFTIDQINEYLNSGEFTSQERAALAGTINAIKDGAVRNLDRNANSLQGANVTDDFSDFYGNENKARKNSGRSTRWANRQARKNSDHHIVNSAIEKFGKIEDYYNPKSSKKSQSTKALQKAQNEFFQFGNDGNYLDDASNYAYEKMLRSGFDYLLNPDARDNWDTTAFSENELEWLNNFYNRNVGYNADDLLKRVKTGKLTQDDRNFLSAFGLVQSNQGKTSQNQRNLFTQMGYDYDKLAPYFEINEKGQIVGRKTEDGSSVFKDLGGSGNYYFNDQFASAMPDYSFLKDHFLIDNVLYKASDATNAESDLYKYLRKSGGFYDLNKAGDWTKADEVIKQFWDGKTRTAFGTAEDAGISNPFLKENPAYRWLSVTGAYDYPLETGQQLVEIYDPNQEVNEYGWGKTRYAVLDKNGNFLNWTDEPGKITQEEARPLKGRKIIRDVPEDNIYYGKEVWQPTISDLAPQFTFYWDPNKKELIYEGDVLLGGNAEGKAVKIPKEIAAIIMRDPEKFVNNLISKDRLNEFQREVGILINNGWEDVVWGGMFGNEMDGADWADTLGISEAEGDRLAELFERYGSSDLGNANQRKHLYLAERYVPQTAVTVQKLGGKINYLKKLQPGGTVGTTETKGHTQYKIEGPARDTRNFAKVGEESFTASDWLEVGALAADLAGMITSATGAPIAGGVVGAVGSTAGFAADINRDGFDWSDLGDYGINLGLDLVSAIPFAGTAAQGAKAAKGIKSVGKTLLKFFNNPKVVKTLAGMGVGNAVVTSVQKIINGESWDMRDIRNVANGLTGIMTLKKTGIFGGSTQKQKTGEIEVKVKGKSDSEKISFSEDELNAIESATKPNEKLRDLIFNKLKTKSKFKGIKAEDIDFSISKAKKKLGWKIWKGKQPTGEYDLNVGKETVSEPLTAEGIASGEQEKQRLLEFLRTGQWYDVVPKSRTKRVHAKTKSELMKNFPDAQNIRGYVHPQTGKIMDYGADVRISKPKKVDFTNKFRDYFKQSWNPFKMSPEARRMMRKANLFRPNMWWNFENYDMIPVGFVAQDESGYQFLKKGGKILKGQNSLTVPEVQDVDPEKFEKVGDEYVPTEKYKQAIAQAKANGTNVIFNGEDLGNSYDTIGTYNGYIGQQNIKKGIAPSWKWSDLSAEEQEAFKVAKSEAEKSKSDFVFKGHNFGKIKASRNDSPSTMKWVKPLQTWREPTDEELSKLGSSREEYETVRLQDQLKAYNESTKNRAGFVPLTLEQYQQKVKDLEANPVQLPDKVEIEEETYDPEDGVDTQKYWEDTARNAAKEKYDYLKSIGATNRKASREAFKVEKGVWEERAKLFGLDRSGNQIPDSIGNPKGNSNQVNGDIAAGMAGAIGRSALEAGIKLSGTNKQLDLARKNLQNVSNSLESNVAEHYGSFSDSGIKEIQDQNASDIESAAHYNVSSDPNRNRQYKKEASAQARKERTLGRYKQSEAYSLFKDDQQKLIGNFAARRAEVENRNKLRLAQAQAALNQAEGAAIAQNAQILGGLAADIGAIAQSPRAERIKNRITGIQREYQDWMSGIKQQYDKGVNDGSISSSEAFNTWFNKDSNRIREKRSFEDRMSPLTLRYNLLKSKKGGKIRPTKEQIKIDNNKLSAKAVNLLSKQAFDLLKMALS